MDVYRSCEAPSKYAEMGVCHVEYKDVDKKQRQIGKVAELMLGVKAFHSMAANYCASLPEAEVEAEDEELLVWWFPTSTS